MRRFDDCGGTPNFTLIVRFERRLGGKVWTRRMRCTGAEAKHAAKRCGAEREVHWLAEIRTLHSGSEV
jgi:hypothetical protein